MAKCILFHYMYMKMRDTPDPIGPYNLMPERVRLVSLTEAISLVILSWTWSLLE